MFELDTTNLSKDNIKMLQELRELDKLEFEEMVSSSKSFTLQLDDIYILDIDIDLVDLVGNNYNVNLPFIVNIDYNKEINEYSDKLGLNGMFRMYKCDSVIGIDCDYVYHVDIEFWFYRYNNNSSCSVPIVNIDNKLIEYYVM